MSSKSTGRSSSRMKEEESPNASAEEDEDARGGILSPVSPSEPAGGTADVSTSHHIGWHGGCYQEEA
eukprot:1733242-Rhodomonas_salina.2